MKNVIVDFKTVTKVTAVCPECGKSRTKTLDGQVKDVPVQMAFLYTEWEWLEVEPGKVVCCVCAVKGQQLPLLVF